MQARRAFCAALLFPCLLLAAAGIEAGEAAPAFDILITGGLVVDGSGLPAYRADVGIRGQKIAAVGDLSGASAAQVIDARGLVVAPGFINMLSWATESLLVDGRALSDLRQGVTLEVFGEGWSMGPLNDAMKKENREQQGDIKYEIGWTTLGDYLEYLVARGVAPNVASFVGATTVRIHVLGYENRAPSPAEFDQMRALVHQAMEEGALGVGSSLIYPPAFFARTEELIELAKVAAEYGGMYISHMRNEGNQLPEAVDELITIARRAGIPAEIYHLKAAGRENWGRLDEVIARVERARAEGLRITADMYTYTAGATGLSASMPPWVQEGGHRAWLARLRDPAIRARVEREMVTPSDEWENLFLHAGPENTLLVGFKNDALKPLTGKTLAEVAAERGKSPQATAIDLVLEDDSRVEAIYFLMSEENVRRQIQLPWVSFGSDAEGSAPEGVFLKSNPHPRAYGTFARLLGKYVREEKLISLEEAVRRLTSLPATNLKIAERGRLAPGYFADIVVFDAPRIQDHATYKQPHQLATGVVHVLVNGTQALKDGEPTGATPGQVVRGPGYRRSPKSPPAQSVPTENYIAGLAAGRAHIVDLSYSISDKLPAWPGDARTFEARVQARAEQAGYFSRNFWMLEHYGTHLDAPVHFPPGRTPVDAIPPERLFGPAVVIDIRGPASANPDYRLQPADVLDWEERHGRIPRGAIVLARTGWAGRWPDEARYRNMDDRGLMHFPGFSVAAVELLVERGASGLGIDTLSVDYGPSTSFEVHRLSHGADLYHLENLADLSALPESSAFLIVAPIKLEGGSGGPVRVFALVGN
ncbi:MAG: cyclase family protein [Acidobacteria bacterium]|nr:cyclase family protein [Acidobacteriota bacterium]